MAYPVVPLPAFAGVGTALDISAYYGNQAQLVYAGGDSGDALQLQVSQDGGTTWAVVPNSKIIGPEGTVTVEIVVGANTRIRSQVLVYGTGGPGSASLTVSAGSLASTISGPAGPPGPAGPAGGIPSAGVGLTVSRDTLASDAGKALYATADGITLTLAAGTIPPGQAVWVNAGTAAHGVNVVPGAGVTLNGGIGTITVLPSAAAGFVNLGGDVYQEF